MPSGMPAWEDCFMGSESSRQQSINFKSIQAGYQFASFAKFAGFAVRDQDSVTSPEIWYRVCPPVNPGLTGQGTGLALRDLGFVSLGKLNERTQLANNELL